MAKMPKEGTFTDHMAKEGQVSHIHTILKIMYAALALYSLIASFVTGDPWFTQIVFYFIFLFQL
jgi:hypothetical protein